MGSYSVSKHGRTRFWAVRDAAGELICVCVYKRGALEVTRRLSGEATSGVDRLREGDEPVQAPCDSLGHDPRATVARLTFEQNAQTKPKGKTP